MRAGIRKKLIDAGIGIVDCYEPNVPNKETQKPYAVVVQSDDIKNNETVGYKRTIEIYFYVDRSSFKKLDEIVNKAIPALHLQTIEDPKTNKLFTCIFNGIVGQDGIDDEWNALYRGLQFNVIALHHENDANNDKWLDSLKEFTNKILEYPVYLNTFQSDFDVPSILWRVKSQNKERLNYSLVKESKTLICHIVSNSKAQISEIIDTIENNLIDSHKIPYVDGVRRYLTIESINEDRDADMFTQGQLTVEFFRLRQIERNVQLINEIHHRGQLK